jgi:hypothetical protein
MIQNKYGLPEQMVKALTSDRKRPEFGRYGITSLIGSPLRRCLSIKHFDDVEEEVSDNLWALLGKAAHYVLESSSSEKVAEQKLELPYKGVTIVGVLDYYDNGSIIDYKVTSVWSIMLGDKKEWEAQLNCYAWMYAMSGMDVTELAIYAILRDWSKMDYMKDPDRYPPIPFIRRKIDLWPLEKTKEYIDGRINLHRQAEALLAENKPIPICTPEERWQRETTWAVAKKESDRATRVLKTEEDCNQYIKDKGLDKGVYSAWKRIGMDVRCLNYCQFYPKFCGGANENSNREVVD